MSASLESGVRQRMESPTSDEEVTLLVKVTETSDSVVDAVNDAGGVVETRLPLDYLAVRIAEVRLTELYELEQVIKMEIEGEGSIMSSDFRTHTGPTL